MKIFLFVLLTIFCLLLASFFPGLAYGVWTWVSPVTEMGRILLAGILLICGMGGFIASLIVAFMVWVAGTDGIINSRYL